VSDGSTGTARGDEPLALVRPWMLRDEEHCPLRLRLDRERRQTTWSPYNQGRLLRPLNAAVLEAHDELRVPDRRWFEPPGSLFPEERAVWEVAVDSYLRRFGSIPAQAARGDLDKPRLPKRGVQLGGDLGLPLELADGIELRRLGLTGRGGPCADPLRDPGVLLAVLRLIRWIDGRPLRIVAVDLVADEADEAVVEPAAVPDLVAVLDERLATLRELLEDPEPRPGRACAWCDHPPVCGAHRAETPLLA
jgi:hypothetical protein